MSALPIDAVLPELVEQVRRAGCVVLEAPPGTGKTTRAPLALLGAGLAGTGEVLVSEPRRIAARLAARHVAETLGQRVGERVGYSVRFENVASKDTRLRYVTDGVLLRRLASEPGLPGVGLVVLDEIHERRLAFDATLALLRRVRQRGRSDLGLVLMSATVDAERLASALGGVPLVRCEGVRFPTETSHLERPDDRPLELQVTSAVKDVVRALEAEGRPGDVLVFLPGSLEIARADAALRAFAEAQRLLVVPLHGSLSLAEQVRAVTAAAQRKVILSTNVAESSITVDGVRVVIDSGLARVAGQATASGIPTLGVAKISRASAAQRAGRASRTGPGRVLRLYTRGDLAARPAYETAELQRLDLSSMLLELHGAGVADPGELPWLDAPPAPALRTAEALLTQLGALSAAGTLSGVGAQMLRLPLPPRLARVVVEGRALGVARDAAAIAALLAERDIRADLRPRSRGVGHAARQGAAGSRGPSGPSDALELLDRLWEAEAEARDDGSLDARTARRLGLDPSAVTAVLRSRDQILRALQSAPTNPDGSVTPPRRRTSTQGTSTRGTSTQGTSMQASSTCSTRSRAQGPATTTADDHDTALLRALLAGFADRVARRKAPQNRELVLCSGATARLAEESVVTEAWWMVVLDVEARSEGRGRWTLARWASAIEPDWLLELGSTSVTTSEELLFDTERDRVVSTARLSYGSVVLDEERGPAVPGPAVAALLASMARKHLPRAFDDADAADQLLRRLGLLARALPESGLVAQGDALLDRALAHACAEATSFADLRRMGLRTALLDSLDAAARDLLAREAPETLTLPGGRRLAIHYEPEHAPWVASRLQDFFGMADTPRVCRGRVPLVVHLLAPNQRAVQVTSDLEGFWRTHYPSLRRELGRRYPRHAWPEDGRHATPPGPGKRR